MLPVLLKIGFLELRSYNVLIALGGILFFCLLKTWDKRMGLRGSGDFWLLVNTIIVSGFIGGRLMHMLLEVPFSSPSFWRILFGINTGFSVFGFVAAVWASVYCYSRVLKLDFVRLLDYVCVIIPIWQAFGRVGCWMNGCCFGRAPLHYLPWATTFTNLDAAIPREFLGVPLHPAQFYEAAGDILIAAFLYVIVLRGIEMGRFARGLVCAGYLAGYGILRFVLEWFRGDTKPYWADISVGQALAFGMLMLSVMFFMAVRRRGGGLPKDRVANRKVFDAPSNECI